MKAQFKNTDYSGTELTLGKKYDVIDVECKKKHEVARILIQNDEGHEKWYEAVRQYTWDIRKYLNYRRMTTKHEWKVFHRALRWEKRRKEAQKDVRKFETR